MSHTSIAIGTPATQFIGSDRYVCEVIEVITDRKVKVRRVGSKRTDLTGNVAYDDLVISLRADGKWREVGINRAPRYFFVLGHAETHLDPSF